MGTGVDGLPPVSRRVLVICADSIGQWLGLVALSLGTTLSRMMGWQDSEAADDPVSRIHPFRHRIIILVFVFVFVVIF